MGIDFLALFHTLCYHSHGAHEGGTAVFGFPWPPMIRLDSCKIAEGVKFSIMPVARWDPSDREKWRIGVRGNARAGGAAI